MSESLFYTRSPKLAPLRKLVEENSNFSYEQLDTKRLFHAVDAYCAQSFPGGDRSGWFPPLIVGGAHLNHTPPHILSAVYGIYADLATGVVDPVPFLSGPLRMDGATAVQLGPGDHYLMMNRNGESAPLTEILIVLPAKLREKWVLDYYGNTKLNTDITVIGWHASADSLFSAMCGGLVFLHHESKTVLNPMASFTTEEEQMFFGGPVDLPRLKRHQERLEEFFGTPADVMKHNHETARSVVKAYFG